MSAAPNSETVSQPKKFPDGFMWGTATAAYQIEGAATENRVESIWDRFSATPGKVENGDTGAVACDHYHRFREDVQLIKSLNTKYYRFSIAWPRIQSWDASGAVSTNEAGVKFYNELIDELLAHGITPVATLYHWDLPVAVEDAHGGWSGGGGVAEAFASYARACFTAFGDRVKWWITLNEPWCSALLGYELGEHAPGDTSGPGVKVYRAGHNLLLAHARAVGVYRAEFGAQAGSIGITLNSDWAEARDAGDAACVAAAERDMEFELGWFADPVYFGDYPACMRARAGDRLPEFTQGEKAALKGSSDFFGLNHYSTHYAAGFAEGGDDEDGGGGGGGGDRAASYFGDRGTASAQDERWKRTDMGWAVVPWGLRKLLRYIQERYAPPGGVIVTENGLAAAEATREDAERDELRVEFYSGYIAAVHDAMQGEGGADVRGYFLWSLMDNFEWAKGYGKRFGLHWVDYETLERTPKPAAKWYAGVVKANSVPAGE